MKRISVGYYFGGLVIIMNRPIKKAHVVGGSAMHVSLSGVVV